MTFHNTETENTSINFILYLIQCSPPRHCELYHVFMKLTIKDIWRKKKWNFDYFSKGLYTYVWKLNGPAKRQHPKLPKMTHIIMCFRSFYWKKTCFVKIYKEYELIRIFFHLKSDKCFFFIFTTKYFYIHTNTSTIWIGVLPYIILPLIVLLFCTDTKYEHHKSRIRIINFYGFCKKLWLYGNVCITQFDEIFLKRTGFW